MKRQSHLPLRLNVIFFLIFILFSFLVIQLGVVQILTGKEAQRVIDETDETLTMVPVPRGKMYDRYGKIIVDNVPKYAITYTPPKNVQPHETLKIAQTLAKYIYMEIESVTERDMKDYWILMNHEEAYSRLSDKEKEEMDNSEEYQTVLKRITKEDLDFSPLDMEIVAIKRELDQAVEFTPYIVKNNNVTEREFARVAEHLSAMPGINVTTDWERDFIYGSTFSNFIGGLTDHDQGIIRDNLDFYLTRQYSRNDRVGTSFLEAEYETILKGQKEQYRYITDSQENVIRTELVQEGKQGKSLVLTIDIELQKQIDAIVQEELERAILKDPITNKYLEDAMVVMMKPKTGEILAMTGIHYYRETEDKPAYFADESYRTVLDAHLPGSTVKGATVLAGFETGVINKNTVFQDSPIKIAGTPWKQSYQPLGPVNYEDALKLSSNVFMFYIAMRMGGDYTYVENAPLDYNPDAFREMRNYFKQFGLGVETGIDLPFEATGLKGEDISSPGLLMDFAIGQYESFTALQLAQYISTIANDGYRVRPHLVKEIREPGIGDELGKLYKVIQPQVINKIQMGDEYIEAVQEGLYLVTQGGTANSYRNLPYKPAVKTGTAQNELYENGELVAETENLTLVGYAPFDNPEIAFAVVVPRVGINTRTGINMNIGKRIMDAYFNMEENVEKEE